jgi:hypoxanthine phosphoribosyltransferase
MSASNTPATQAPAPELPDPPKHYVAPDRLRVLGFKLGAQVYESGFRPDYIIAILRGGGAIALYVHEFFKLIYKLKHPELKPREGRLHYPDCIGVLTSSYNDAHTQTKEIRVHGLEYIVKNGVSTDKILLVDDIFDTGRSVAALKAKLERKMKANTPADIRTATIFRHYETGPAPEYYMEVNTDWVAFPHEISDMTVAEIKKHFGSEIAETISNALALPK